MNSSHIAIVLGMVAGVFILIGYGFGYLRGKDVGRLEATREFKSELEKRIEQQR